MGNKLKHNHHHGKYIKLEKNDHHQEHHIRRKKPSPRTSYQKETTIIDNNK
jgi:hypothetical protein